MNLGRRNEHIMSHRWRASLNTVVVAVALHATASPAAQGQAIGTPARKTFTAKTWMPARTLDGQPDLQGIWANNSATPLERPAVFAGRALLTDAEVTELKARAARLFDDAESDFPAGDAAFLAALANPEHFKNPNAPDNPIYQDKRDFDSRTSLVVTPSDGKIPFTPEGTRRQAAALERRLHPAPDDPEDLPNDLRCITFGVPRLGAGYNSYYQVVQTRGYVVLFGEVIHDARIIPLDGRPHLPANIRQWNGDSRGRWEGQTLIVDTTNFSSKSYFLGSTEDLHLVERFTRIAEGTIEYKITATDPSIWKQAWSAVILLKQTKDKIYEFACHEGNYEIMFDMLAGARIPK
jgi:hypothetical protein